MIIGGVHTDISHAPTTTMFVRAGGGVKKKDDHSATVSPAKAIDSRSKCYKQLSDLKNLLESGILLNLGNMVVEIESLHQHVLQLY